MINALFSRRQFQVMSGELGEDDDKMDQVVSNLLFNPGV